MRSKDGSAGTGILTRATSPRELLELAAGGELFALLDACDTPTVPAKATEVGRTRAACLLIGNPSQESRETAPYVFRLDRDSLTWILDSLGTEPWGILVLAKKDLEVVRRHLNQFLVVQDPERQPLFFRFYDPRVLPTFLASANSEEIERFIGPLLGFGVVPPGTRAAVLYYR